MQCGQLLLQLKQIKNLILGTSGKQGECSAFFLVQRTVLTTEVYIPDFSICWDKTLDLFFFQKQGFFLKKCQCCMLYQNHLMRVNIDQISIYLERRKKCAHLAQTTEQEEQSMKDLKLLNNFTFSIEDTNKCVVFTTNTLSRNFWNW